MLCAGAFCYAEVAYAQESSQGEQPQDGDTASPSGDKPSGEETNNAPATKDEADGGEARPAPPAGSPLGPEDASRGAEGPPKQEAPATDPRGEPTEKGSGTSERELEAPKLLKSTPPRFPEAHAGKGKHPTVVVEVTLDDQGKVTEARVEDSAGADFDAAAVEAVRGWTFSPAKRAGKAVASQVHVAVHFDLPSFDLASPVPGVSAGHAHSSGAARDDEVRGAISGAVLGARYGDETFGAQATVDLEKMRQHERGAADLTVNSETLRSAPRLEGAEVLRSAPGVYIGRAEGDAVAHRIMLRGFDAEHGQDLELKVAGMPINLPSHIHGQGYADLGFLMAETTRELEVKEGVYDPSQGDFAVAGSIDVKLGYTRPKDSQGGWMLKSKYGSFDTFQQLALWSPIEGDEETFAAVQYRRTDGFGQRRFGRGVSAMSQVRLGGSKGWSYLLRGVFYGVRADLAGVLRKDDIDAGNVGFYDAYPFPSAQSQNALTGRALVGASAEYRGHDGESGELGLWFGYDNFRLQQNFTGFTQRSRTLEGVAGRGDLIEQRNRTLSIGMNGRYRTSAYKPASWLEGTVELGLTGRFDSIEQDQNLLDASVRSQTWDRRVDTGIEAGDIGVWGDLDWDFSKFVTLRFGMRADVLLYDVNDRLGNFVPLTRADDAFIEGFRRSSLGVAFGPRTSLEVKPLPWLSLLAAYGEGYRSPQARTLEDGERAPFTKVRSTDIGVRVNWSDILSSQISGFYTRLSDDVAFEAREGRLERIGATQRLGLTFHTQAKPLPWLTGAFSFTYVDAELLEPPPPTAEAPLPVFEEGQNLPFVPPIVVRLDLGAHHTFREAITQPVLGRRADLSGRVGTGLSYLSSRPLPFGAPAAPFALVDASASLTYGPFTLGLEVFNLLDSRYAAVEYNFVSDWNPEAVPDRLPARHTAAGSPRTLLGTLSVEL